MLNILFVCTGNICRSPTAQGVMEVLVVERELDKEIFIDSAGTHAYHAGEPPDRRSVMAAQQRGIDISGLRARQINKEDFQKFDLILAMDNDNVMHLRRSSTPRTQSKIHLLMNYADPSQSGIVHDPYYGGSQGFDLVLDMTAQACEKILDKFQQGQLASVR